MVYVPKAYSVIALAGSLIRVVSPLRWLLREPIVAIFAVVSLDVRLRAGTSKTLRLSRLVSHCYCYADLRFSNPMVCGLDAYAMKRCRMKRKSITSDTPNLPGHVRTTYDGGSLVVTGASVPEPANLTFLLAGFGALVIRRRLARRD